MKVITIVLCTPLLAGCEGFAVGEPSSFGWLAIWLGAVYMAYRIETLAAKAASAASRAANNSEAALLRLDVLEDRVTLLASQIEQLKCGEGEDAQPMDPEQIRQLLR